MTKERKARVATVLVLSAALGIAVWRTSGWRGVSADQSPQDAIYGMLNAARAGNVKSYLASFGGPMEASLRQTVVEKSESGFAKYLQDSNTAIKGVAVSDPQKVTDVEASVRVEYVFQDRNEAQVLYLEKGQGGWKITRADGQEQVKTLIPYGTPVK